LSYGPAGLESPLAFIVAQPVRENARRRNFSAESSMLAGRTPAENETPL